MVLYTTCLLFEKKLEPKSDKVKVKVEKICSILEFVKVTTLELSSNDNGEKNVPEKGVPRRFVRADEFEEKMAET